MPKYINADKLSVIVRLLGSKEAIDIIQNMPSADVRENIHGEWETIDYDDGEYEFRCSNCRSQYDMPTLIH